MDIRQKNGPESWVTSCFSKSQRYSVAQLRFCMENTQEENRVCELSDLGEMESESELTFTLYILYLLRVSVCLSKGATKP